MATFSLDNAGRFISLSEAVLLTTRFRKNKDTVIVPDYSGRDILPTCETISKDLIERLLAKPGCAAIRLYSGMDEDLKLHAVVVAVNEKGEDMLPSATLANLAEEDVIEDSLRCPPFCPPPSPLNEN